MLTHTHNKNILWEVELHEELHGIHQRVVNAVHLHRVGMLHRCADHYTELPVQLQREVELYGMAGVMEHYRPHMTLFYGKASYEKIGTVAETLKPEIAEEQRSFRADTLAVGEIGYQGNVVSILHRIKLDPNEFKLAAQSVVWVGRDEYVDKGPLVLYGS
jgi:hypothetical protein